jgi:hypothetical protein
MLIVFLDELATGGGCYELCIFVLFFVWGKENVRFVAKFKRSKKYTKIVRSYEFIYK